MITAHVTATVEHKDGRVEFRSFTVAHWTINRLKRRIRERIKTETPDASVRCGNGYYVNNYGAH